MSVPKEVAAYFSGIGTIGGKSRWKNRTKAERSAFMSRIAKLPRKKKLSTGKLD